MFVWQEFQLLSSVVDNANERHSPHLIRLRPASEFHSARLGANPRKLVFLVVSSNLTSESHKKPELAPQHR
jgi:hypothetical protein